MKLHTANGSLRYHRSIRRTVTSLADHNRLIVDFTEIRMNEIEESVVFDAGQKRMRTALSHLVPPNLRHHKIPGKASHAPAHQTQPGSVPKLLRLFEQHLHPHADSQERLA